MAISKPSLSDASGKIIPSFTNWEIYVRAVAVLILKTLHNSEIVKYGFLIGNNHKDIYKMKTSSK